MKPELPPSPDDQAESRITALLLGQLTDAEVATLRQEMAGNAELARLHDRLKRAIELVRQTAGSPGREGIGSSEAPRLSGERREKLLATFKTVRPAELARRKERSVRRRELLMVAAMLACLFSVAALMLPVLSKSKSLASRREDYLLREDFDGMTGGRDLNRDGVARAKGAEMRFKGRAADDSVLAWQESTPVRVETDPVSSAFALATPAPRFGSRPSAGDTLNEFAGAPAMVTATTTAPPPPPAEPGKPTAPESFDFVDEERRAGQTLRRNMTISLPQKTEGEALVEVPARSSQSGGRFWDSGVAAGQKPVAERQLGAQGPATFLSAAPMIAGEPLARTDREVQQNLTDAKSEEEGRTVVGFDVAAGGVGGNLGAHQIAAPNQSRQFGAIVLGSNLQPAPTTAPGPGVPQTPASQTRWFGNQDRPAVALDGGAAQPFEQSVGPSAPGQSRGDSVKDHANGLTFQQSQAGLSEGKAASNWAFGRDHDFSQPNFQNFYGGVAVQNAQGVPAGVAPGGVTAPAKFAETVQDLNYNAPQSPAPALPTGGQRSQENNAGRRPAADQRGTKDNGAADRFYRFDAAKTTDAKIEEPKSHVALTGNTSVQDPKQVLMELVEAPVERDEVRKTQELLESEAKKLAALASRPLDETKRESAVREAQDAYAKAAKQGEEVRRSKLSAEVESAWQTPADSALAKEKAAVALGDLPFVDKSFKKAMKPSSSSLESVRVAGLQSDALPLGQVIENLRQQLQASGSAKPGEQVVAEYVLPEGAGAAIQPTTGLPVEGAGYFNDLETIAVRIPNAVTNMAVKDALALIERSAERPIRLEVQGSRIVVSKAEAKLKQDNQEPAIVPKSGVREAPLPQPEVLTAENAISTFSLNVSDVSFKLAAASLEKGQMPDVSTVRTEEFINAFDYRDPEPAAGAPVAFHWERARYPFAHNRDLIRLSVKTAAVGRQPGRPMNLVLLVDNSGSMERADRVRIRQECLRVLASQLRAEDRVSVIAFARTPRLWVDGLAGNQAGELPQRIGTLTPEGGTNLEDAMDLAYQTVRRHFQAKGVNRVVLLTDGAANLGNVEPKALQAKVETNRRQGVALDCFGIGWDGYNDELLETLSRNGDGRYGFINTPEAAVNEFAGQLAGALRVAASDVKVQVQFNPQRVTAYRQMGYAKHQLKKEQFRDNTVDAAEIGAAEAGNALYVVEVNPTGVGPLGVARVRFKVPGTHDYRELEWTLTYDGTAPALDRTTPTLKLAGVAAAFSEWLVSSPFAGEVRPNQLLSFLSGVPQTYPADPRPKQLESMIRQAGTIAGR